MAYSILFKQCGSDHMTRGRSRAIGIEVVSAGENFSATEIQKLAWLVKRLMTKYGIGASGIIRHYDVTGKLCPASYVSASKWAALTAAIVKGAAAPSGGGDSVPGGGGRGARTQDDRRRVRQRECSARGPWESL